jgi:hypothetical protein
VVRKLVLISGALARAGLTPEPCAGDPAADGSHAIVEREDLLMPIIAPFLDAPARAG